MPKQRKHAAIMFTDIVGYTALMGSDEDRAFEILSKNRKIHQELIQRYNGTLIKEIGDGMLISFDLASDAVYCAVEIQKKSKEHDIPLKIGIHEGEIVFEDHDVLGDGVNIASRLEADTKAGCISISGSVYYDIRNKADISTNFISEMLFKNVNQPIKVFHVNWDGGEMNEKSGHLSSNLIHQDKSIIVLPFKNISPDPDQEYFCEGISEEIINALTYIKDLKVIARTSSFSFKNMEVDELEIGRRLGVKFVLAGNVRKEQTRLRITVKLIAVEDGSILYSERFDRELKDLFDIQDDITSALIEKLKIKLSDEETEIFSESTHENLEVHNLYLLARYHMYRMSEDGINRAMEYVERIRKIDPEFGPAYLITGGIYALLGGSGVTVMPPKIAIPKSKEAFLKAIDLDPNLAEAHAHLCWLYWGYERKIANAENHIKKALELNANHVEVRRNHAWFNTYTGNFKGAIQEINKAIEIDPCFALVYQNAAFHYYFNKQNDRAIQFASKALEIDPNIEWPYMNIGIAYIQEGKLQKAIEALRKAPNIGHFTDGFLGYAYAQTGKIDLAKKLINGWPDRMNQGLASASGLALIYLGLGDIEQALKWIEAANLEKPAASVYTSLVHIDPIWDSLRDDSRFNDIMIKMGFQKN